MTLLVLVIPLVFVFASLFLISLKKEVFVDIGKSLLTGSVLSFVILLLQIHLDDQRRAEQKEEQFRFSVSFAQDLNGLEPEFSLAGMYLSGKSMNHAELAREDLSDANLQQVSLRGADLEGANLEDTSLYGADLAGATTLGANFRHADLRAAKLHLTTVTLPVEASDFVGAKVNSRTCWPDDYLAQLHSPGFSELRHALRPEATEEHGRTLVEAGSERAYGRACGLADQSIWDDLSLYGKLDADVVGPEELRQTADGIARTFGRGVADIVDRFDRAGSIAGLGAAAPAVEARICAGSRRIVARRADLGTQGWAGWIVRRPGQSPAETLFIRQPAGEPDGRYAVEFAKPLEQGSILRLIVEMPGMEPEKSELRRLVRPCGG